LRSSQARRVLKKLPQFSEEESKLMGHATLKHLEWKRKRKRYWKTESRNSLMKKKILRLTSHRNLSSAIS
jgi:hypothetical protein